MGFQGRKVQFLTADARRNLPGLYATEKVGFDDKVMHVKFFNPYGDGSWFACEFDGSDIMFGAVVMRGEVEWGYFSLAEMERQPAMICGRRVNCQGIERDRSFLPGKWSDVIRREYPGRDDILDDQLTHPANFVLEG